MIKRSYFLKSPRIIVVNAHHCFLRIEQPQSNIIRLPEIRRLASILRKVVHHIRQDVNHDARGVSKWQIFVFESTLPRHDVSLSERLVLCELFELLPQISWRRRLALLRYVLDDVAIRVLVGPEAGVAKNAVLAFKAFVFGAPETFCPACGADGADVPDVVVWAGVLDFNQSFGSQIESLGRNMKLK